MNSPRNAGDLQSAQGTQESESPSPTDSASPVATVPEPDREGGGEPPNNPRTLGKSADRPHWITIALGFLSPAIALVALFISFKSLDLGIAAQKIAQRAYVAGDLSAEEEEFRLQELKNLPPYLRIWHVSVNMNNAGNTPATIVLENVEQHENDKGYKYEVSWTKNLAGTMFVNGKGKATEALAILPVNEKMFKDSHLAILLPQLRVQFRYSDVFGDEHKGFMACNSTFLKGKLHTDCSNFNYDDPTKE